MRIKTHKYTYLGKKKSAVIVALIAAVVFFCLPATSSAFQSLEDCLTWGDNLYEAKDYLGAAEYYDRGLKIVTDNHPKEDILIGQIQMRIGQCYLHVSNFNEALIHFSEALKRGKNAKAAEPDKAKIVILMSYNAMLDIYDSIGLEKQMLEVTDEFIIFIKEYQKDPLPEKQISKSDVNNFLAYCYAQKGENLDEALKLIDEALKEKPENYAMMDTKGWILHKMGENKKALKLLKKALEMCEKKGERCTVIERHVKEVEKADSGG
ncbi:MAG: tetratricopeptide repeat protein [Deltaproteobacteria bacterium]|uniref:Tetratricopeptide repeat protein n=1 Tax=Candidatus Zymogenus saltonus TaxID=2844893 RepID=A0A9D8KG09_9DELT|nr:tetratricopeptide repeat protein [Candidatus Zymogenus saltonus]